MLFAVCVCCLLEFLIIVVVVKLRFYVFVVGDVMSVACCVLCVVFRVLLAV